MLGPSASRASRLSPGEAHGATFGVLSPGEAHGAHFRGSQSGCRGNLLGEHLNVFPYVKHC